MPCVAQRRALVGIAPLCPPDSIIGGDYATFMQRLFGNQAASCYLLRPERWQSGRMRRFAKPVYGLTPVPRVRIPPSPPRSLDCREIRPPHNAKYAKNAHSCEIRSTTWTGENGLLGSEGSHCPGFSLDPQRAVRLSKLSGANA